MRKIMLVMVLVVSFLLFGCARTNERDVFRFEAHQLEMNIGETLELKLVYGSVSPKEEIIYSVVNETSSTEEIIALENNKVIALSKGRVKVTAQVKSTPSTRATVEITVSDVRLSGLKIDGVSEIEVMKETTLKVDTIPSSISLKEVVWSSSDPSIASVSSTGLVKTHKPGDVVISAMSKYDETMIAKKAIKVLYLKSEELNLEFTEGDSNVVLGKTSVLKATVLPAFADQTIKWSSSDVTIAKVENGIITPVKVSDEEVVITAETVDGIKKEINVKVVYAPVETINVTSTLEVVEVFEEKTITLRKQVLPETASQEVVWSSSDPSIATVDEKGVVTGIKKGTVIIKATSIDGTKAGELEVTVVGVPDPESIGITVSYKDPGDTLVIEVECDETLRVTILPSDAKQEIEYSVDVDDVIEVSKVGVGYKVLGLKVGTAKITFTSKVNPAIQRTITINIIPLEE